MTLGKLPNLSVACYLFWENEVNNSTLALEVVQHISQAKCLDSVQHIMNEL